MITSTITVVLFSTIVRTLILHTLLLFLAQMFERMPETVPEIRKNNYDTVVIDCFNMIVQILNDIFSFALGVWVDHQASSGILTASERYWPFEQSNSQLHI